MTRQTFLTWVYQPTQAGTFMVGFYTPGGAWITDTEYSDREAAARRAHYLNGGTDEGV